MLQSEKKATRTLTTTKNNRWRRLASRPRAILLVALLTIVGGGYLLAPTFAASSDVTIDSKLSKHDTSQSGKISMTGFSTTQANDLIVAYIDSDGPGKSQGQYFKSVTGGNLTWKLIVRSNIQNGTSEIWEAVAPNPLSSISITATRAVSGYNGDMTVVSYAGADTTTNGAIAQTNSLSGAPTVSLTTTRTNSWVWATGNDWDSATARTVGTNQTLADQFVDTYSQDTYWSQHQTSPTAPAGTNIMLNNTSPTGDRWNMAAIEILPSSIINTPTAPTNLVATAGTASDGTQNVTLSWNASTETNGTIASYTIYRNNAQLGTTTSPSYTDTAVSPSTTYSYYVTSTDTTGNSSAPSATVSVTTPATSCPASQTGTPPNCVSGTIWQPTAATPISWYWQLNGTVDLSHQVQVYDIDGFDNTAATVSTLHSQGTKAICYIDVGTWENWRSDASSFPASVLGNTNGWPGEKWLDIRQLSILEPLMTNRMQMCIQKGFDAIEPDNIDGYTNTTGFPLTAQDQLTYNEWIAQEAHSLGLSVGLKNDVGQTTDLQPYFDWALDEQCNQYSECSTMAPFTAANKAVFNAEYSGGTGFCSADAANKINGVLYNLNLDGTTYQPCTIGW